MRERAGRQPGPRGDRAAARGREKMGEGNGEKIGGSLGDKGMALTPAPASAPQGMTMMMVVVASVRNLFLLTQLGEGRSEIDLNNGGSADEALVW